jgi:hypothetical protein
VVVVCRLLHLTHHGEELRERVGSTVGAGSGVRDIVRMACCIVRCGNGGLAEGRDESRVYYQYLLFVNLHRSHLPV